MTVAVTKKTIYNYRWRAKNRERWLEISRRSQRRRYLKNGDEIRAGRIAEMAAIREACIFLKETLGCYDCCQHDAAHLMDFDHVRGTNKRSPGAARTWNELWDELEKCDIVCVRCHRQRTWERRVAQA